MNTPGKKTLAQYVNLSHEQKEVVDTWGQGLAVLAGAGSGKTTTLVIKCQELLKRDPEARIAAVSFTERSASDIRAKLAERDVQLARHWVTTIHGLCGQIIREFPREAGFDGEETMLSEPDSRALWEEALEALWFGALTPEAEGALELLLAREGRQGVSDLVHRVRDLEPFGAIQFLEQSEDPDSRALALVAREIVSRYRRLKRRRGALDFGDLEQGADRALEHEHVRRGFHERFALVLVDEFQDTNPLQAAILTRFVRADLSNLCVVGDPKQSIYRFRDADVSVFEEFCARLPRNITLTYNFRSRPGIIHYTNEVCGQAFAQTPGEGLGAAMRYDALDPQRKPAEGDGIELDPVVRLDVRSPEELGRWILAEEARGIRLDDLALLVRRIRGNEKWFKALAACGIPIALGSGGLFWEDPRVRELVALLRWWDQPTHTLSAAAFLRAPWVGVPDSQLDAWVKENRTFVGPFFDSAHPIARALAPLRGRVVRPGELLMAVAVNDEVEAEIGSSLLGLWHRVEDMSSRGMAFHSVVTELSEAVETGRRERDVPPPRGQGSLSVLTFHSSKGLEFPHVILIDLGAKSRAMPSPLLFWDRRRGTYLVRRDEDGKRDDKAPAFQLWKAMEKEKSLAESKRLFYVALTRARERLVLVCPELPEKIREKGFDPATAYLDDDWRAWVECAGFAIARAKVPEASARAAARPEKAAETRAPRERPEPPRFFRPRHSVTEWNLLSRCPRAYVWRYLRPEEAWQEKIVPETQKAAVEREAAVGGERWLADPERSQREIGSRVHKALEFGDAAALQRIEAEAGGASGRFVAAPVIEWLRSSAWFSQDFPAWSEFSFEIPVAGEILVGSIDRLVEADGRLNIIDFKVTASSAKGADELIAAYGTQMSLYAAAVAALEPESARVGIGARLVHISPAGVEEI